MSSSEEAKAARRRQMGAVIRLRRGDVTQAELGRLMDGLPQTTLSRWEKGIVDLTYEQVFALEEALKLDPGTIGTDAGYVQPSKNNRDVEAIIRSDARVHPSLRNDLVSIYKSYVELSTARRAAERAAELKARPRGGRTKDDNGKGSRR